MEFSIVVLPFISLLLFVLQIGFMTMTKMALDAGVLLAAEGLEAQFASTTAPTTPSGAALKASVAANAGGLYNTASQLKVEVQPLSNLTAAPVAITDQYANYGVAKTILAVRATYTGTNFVPGLSSIMTVHASTLVRRGNL